MGLSLRGATSGAIDINAPAVAGDNTITLPLDNGSANQFFKNSGTAGIVTYSSMTETPTGDVAFNGVVTVGADPTDSGSSYPQGINLNTGGYAVIRRSGGLKGLFLGPSGSSSYNIRLGSGGEANFMGNVGIGTDNPDNYNPNADDLVIFGTGHQGLTIRSGTLHDGSIMFNDTNNANQRGIIRYLHTDDSMAFHTSGGEALRITSGGNVGIGTDNPSHKLDVRGNGLFNTNTVFIRETDSTGAQLMIQNSSTGTTTGDGLLVGIDDNEVAYIYNYENTDLVFGTAGTERARITSAGEVQIANGNLKLSTSGTGIDFSATGDATGATSELLDDYEEGLHTTTMSATSGTVTVSTSNDTLSYVKIGNQVTVIGRPVIDSVSSPTGNLSISLPFTSANVTESGGRAAGSVNLRLVDTGYDVGLFTAYIDEGSSSLRIQYGGSTDQQPAAPAMKSATQIWISVTYRTT